MTITLVGQAGTTAAQNIAPTITYSSTSGNLLVVMSCDAQHNTSFDVPPFVPTDSAGNIYQTVVVGLCAISYCLNAAAVTSISPQIFANAVSAASVMEFSGLGNFIDVSNQSGTTTSASPTLTIGTSLAPVSLAVSGVIWGDSVTNTAASISAQTAGWTPGTLRTINGSGGGKINASVQQAYRILSSTTALTYGATLSNSTSWSVAGIVFDAAKPQVIVKALQAVNRSAYY